MTRTPPPPPLAADPATPAPAIPPTPDRDPVASSRGARLAIFLGLALVLAAAAIVAVLVTWASPVSQRYSAAGGTSVAVNVPNARLDFVPSTDGAVRVQLTGFSSGPAPDLRVATAGDTTTIEGGCSGAWFTRCELDIRVEIPAAAAIQVLSTNGRVTLSGLDGDIAVETSNGAVELREVSGTLDLRTSNAAITVTDCTSDDVGATTTNGAIGLDFSEAPTTVHATSTNGAITVRAPDEVPYFIDASTTNGGVDTDALPSDRFADRTITISTTNGGILVEPSR
jgi:hypothetical protein